MNEPSQYGQGPETWGLIDLPRFWTEYMHYLYLPVDMPTRTAGFRLPPNLAFLTELLSGLEFWERSHFGNRWDYIYITARRGYAAPGNPLNRPGWHADGFGTQDINYIWSDRWPTRFALLDFADISTDHVRSAEQFEEQIAAYQSKHGFGGPDDCIVSGKPLYVYRLTPEVIHSTPIIPAPGGDRSFLKVSFSNDKYNLLGNSHNHLFDYKWKMHDRRAVRNDPAYAGGDAGPDQKEIT